MRKRIFEIIERSEKGDRASLVYDIFMIIVIVSSLVPLAFKSEDAAFVALDRVCVAIFIVDYILRLMTADLKFNKMSVVSFLRYPFSPMAIVDLLSILPSLGVLKVLRMARTLRALRVLRILKVGRYSESVRIIACVFRRSKRPLLAVTTLSLVYILVAALVMINVEPESFETYFDAVYWATVSLTTVGYGNISPVTAIGRAVTMISSLFGIALIALPSGIITAGFMHELSAKTNGKSGDIPYNATITPRSPNAPHHPVTKSSSAARNESED